MNKRLAIIVPYRDRRKQLDIFIPHIDSFLKDKGIDYQIIVAEQRDDRPFNRGQLCNAAFDVVKDDFDYFCFHDVSLLPMTDDCDYSFTDEPTHLAMIVDDVDVPYVEFTGGVFLISKEHFEQSNGFSDEYWGWGFEDIDLLHRMKKKELPLESLIDISSTSDNIKYTFSQVYLHNNHIKKTLNKIQFEKETCLEIETTKSTDNLTSNSFTFSTWVNPKEEDYEQFILTRPPIGFGITYTPECDFKFTVWDEKSTAFVIEDFRKANSWYHLCMTYDKDDKNLVVYINGSVIEVKKIRNKLEDFSGEWFYIGSNSEKEDAFTGDMSETVFWNTSLDINQVRTIYLDSVENVKNKPVLHYKFDKGYGSFILDETRNENNGVFVTNTKNPNQFISRQKDNWHPTSKENPDYAYTGENPKDRNISWNTERFPFGSTQRLALIGNKAKMVGNKFINHSKEDIVLGVEIKVPYRRFGNYKSLNTDSEVLYGDGIIEKLKSYDPDILQNRDIFFDEVRPGTLDTDEIGLNYTDYQLSSRKKYEEHHEWLEIIT